jgi:heavy metal response regulator
MNILLVEDEERIAAFIRKGLQEEYYTVDVVRDGATALEYAAAAPYNVVILDVRLPVLDGFSVCAELRARGDQTPVLMLTARDTVDDRVHGLNIGADDYLVKPFAFKELLARVRALSRRPPMLQGTTLRLADLELNMLTHSVQRGGRVIELSALEYRLLEFLMTHAGQVLTRTQITDQVWGFDYDPRSNVVDVYIRFLRRKIDEPFEPKLIQTVRGSGYKLSPQAD